VLSPRTWGCTARGYPRLVVLDVVPTHVGVYRRIARVLTMIPRCPHARGGVPYIPASHPSQSQLSPRTWGCTAARQQLQSGGEVVPTHVGVYRTP